MALHSLLLCVSTYAAPFLFSSPLFSSGPQCMPEANHMKCGLSPSRPPPPSKMMRWIFGGMQIGRLKCPGRETMRGENGSLVAHPHLLVRVTSERFLPAGSTFRHGLAGESHWLQPMLVLIFAHTVSVGGL